MEEKQIKTKAISNLIWRFAERAGAQGVAFIVSIVLARLLDPDAYGTVAILTVFTTIFQVFVDSGMGNALIQKKDADQLDFSTVFYFNMAMCLIIYAIIFIISPAIAYFYQDDSLTALMRVLGITVIVSGFKNIQQAYVSRHLLFRKFFFSTLGGTIFAAVVGITMAYKGFGAWALVAQHIVNTIVDTAILYITVKWRPTKQFSFNRLKHLFSYGWKLLVSALLDTVYSNIRSLIIGKVYSSSDLAYYNKGKQFPNLIVSNINNSIDSVLLPVMSGVQDQVERVKNMTRRSIKLSSYIIWPMMFGLAVCAEPFVKLVLTDKWLPAVPYIQIFCFTFAFYPIHTANLNAIKALGRSDLFLKMDVIKKVIGLVSIVLTIKFGVMAIAIGMAATSPISSFINAYPNKKLLNYSYGEQLLDLMPALILSAGMGVVTYCVKFLKFNTVTTLLIQIFVGVFVYILGSVITKNECFFYLIDTIKKIRGDAN